MNKEELRIILIVKKLFCLIPKIVNVCKYEQMCVKAGEYFLQGIFAQIFVGLGVECPAQQNHQSCSIFAPTSMRHFDSLLFTIGAILALSGCQAGSIYEQKVSFPAKGWSADSAYVFQFPIADASASYDILYHIRHDLDYPYYNLFIQAELSDSAGNGLVVDKHEMILLDAETGKPLGSGLGGVYSKDFIALARVHFPKPGIYKAKVSQFMREPWLAGIKDFALQVKKSE